MKIILTNREWYAICKEGVKGSSKRKKFGASDLANKIFEQFKVQIDAKEFEEIKTKTNELFNGLDVGNIVVNDPTYNILKTIIKSDIDKLL